MVAITGAAPFLFRRGSRMLPAYPDLRKPTTAHTGTAAVTASDATVVAVAGQTWTGTAAVTAQDASARAYESLPPVTPTGPAPFVGRRPGRMWVIDDQRIFKNVALNTKEGTAAALAQPATVSASIFRIVTGTATPQAQDATVVAADSRISGVASAFAASPVIVGVGKVTTNASAAVTAGPAFVAATGVREITATAAPQSQDAQAAAVGGIEGAPTGVLIAQAGDASVAAFASRGFTGTAAVQAQDADAASEGVVVKPLIPVFNDVPELLSRQYRDTEIDFAAYLRQGDEPITWQVVSGGIPAGMTLDPITGVVSGMPTTISIYDFILRATNVTGAAETNVVRWLVSDTIPKNGLASGQNVVTIEGI